MSDPRPREREARKPSHDDVASTIRVTHEEAPAPDASGGVSRKPVRPPTRRTGGSAAKRKRKAARRLK